MARARRGPRERERPQGVWRQDHGERRPGQRGTHTQGVCLARASAFHPHGVLGSSGTDGTAAITPFGPSEWLEPTTFKGSVGWDTSQLFPLTAFADGSVGSSRVVWDGYGDFRGTPFLLNTSQIGRAACRVRVWDPV